MQPFDEQLERLKKTVGADSDTALACYLGITQGSMSGAKAKKRIPPAWFFQIADQTGASIDFLYSGKTERSVTDSAPSPGVQACCSGCAILERALLNERQERQMLNQENKELLRENGELKGQIQVLQERLNAGTGRTI